VKNDINSFFERKQTNYMDRLTFHAFVKKHNILLFPIAELKLQLHHLFLSTNRWEQLLKDRQERFPYENYSLFDLVAEYSRRKGGSNKVLKAIAASSKKRSTVYTTNTSLAPSLDSLDEHNSNHFGVPVSTEDNDSPNDRRGSFGSISYQVEGSAKPHSKKTSHKETSGKKSDKSHKLNLHLITPKDAKIYTYDSVETPGSDPCAPSERDSQNRHLSPLPPAKRSSVPKPAGDITPLRSLKTGQHESPTSPDNEQPPSPSTTVGSVTASVTDRRRHSKS
jgi:hypothetical protein